MVLSGCMRCYFKTLQNRGFRFPGAAAGNAQAVLNVPLVLIVQPRKHRKVSTTLVWNGRNCLCHGSTQIRLRRSYTCILQRPRPASVRETGAYPEDKGIKELFFSTKKKASGLCLQQTANGDCGSTLVINRRGVSSTYVFFPSYETCLTCYCQ